MLTPTPRISVITSINHHPVWIFLPIAAVCKQAALGLYQEMSPCLQPSPSDWLLLRFQEAARRRWKVLQGRCRHGDPQALWSLVPAVSDAYGDDQDPDYREAGVAAGAMQPLGRRNTTRQTQHAMAAGGREGMGKAAAVYTTLCHVCTLIQEDLAFDLQLVVSGMRVSCTAKVHLHDTWYRAD